MATLAVRKAAWNKLTARNKRIVRAVGDLLDLGQPAEYRAPGGGRWLVFDDNRFKAVDIARVGALLANLSDVPAGYQPPTSRRRLRQDTKRFVEHAARRKRYRQPSDIPHVEGVDRWQEILDAQQAPRSIRMGSGVPAGWTPVEVI